MTEHPKSESALPDSNAISIEYAPARRAIQFFLFGYLLMCPTVLFMSYVSFTKAPNGLEPFLFAALAAILLGAIFILIASFGLLSSPRENEKQQVAKYLGLMGLSIALTIAARVMGWPFAAEVVADIIKAYGTYALIHYFEILAFNLQSFKLVDGVHHVKRTYIVGVVALFGSMFLVGILQLPMLLLGGVIILWGVVFFSLWLRMLVLAIELTGGDISSEHKSVKPV